MATSSYGTLEKLAADLGQSLKEQLGKIMDDTKSSACQITIGLEKPIAVSLADTPRIEFRAP